jgi:hypothetical protein
MAEMRVIAVAPDIFWDIRVWARNGALISRTTGFNRVTRMRHGDGTLFLFAKVHGRIDCHVLPRDLTGGNIF